MDFDRKVSNCCEEKILNADTLDETMALQGCILCCFVQIIRRQRNVKKRQQKVRRGLGFIGLIEITWILWVIFFFFIFASLVGSPFCDSGVFDRLGSFVSNGGEERKFKLKSNLFLSLIVITMIKTIANDDNGPEKHGKQKAKPKRVWL